jgi:hypothetical protein
MGEDIDRIRVVEDRENWLTVLDLLTNTKSFGEFGGISRLNNIG